MGNIYLEPIRHVYIDDETKEEFKSVTTVISELETEFQSDIIAEAIEKQSPERKKEKYKGLTKQQILDYWEEENRVANEYGTKIHNILETYLKKKKFYFPTDVEEQEIINAYDELNIDLGFKYYCERILFHRKYKIAGTTDHIVDIEPDFFTVNDYKTNRVINYYSPYGNKLLKPVNFLDDCQYNVYALQLSIYAYFYEVETGKRCRQMRLLYYDRILKKFQIIPVPYMKMEAIAILENYIKKS